MNKVYNQDFLTNSIPDKSVQLIIADPPYFEVKGDFDFIWKSFDDYLIDVEKWAIECKRVLADNGTLFWWGHAKKIAYSQMVLDKYFNLENSLVWENTNPHKQQIRFSDGLRSFAPISERLLMYSNEIERTGLEEILMNPAFYGLMSYFKKERLKIGWNYSQCDEYLGIKSSYCYWDKPTTHPFRIPEKEHYLKLQQTGFWQKPYEDLRKEYEELRKEYEELRRPFSNSLHLGDVFKFPNYETKNYDHDTVKPETLTRALILTCSRPNDLVLAPFAGSGTECAMAAKEGRNFIGFEITERHAVMAQKRANVFLSQQKLF